jgi:copper chaperone CopZ
MRVFHQPPRTSATTPYGQGRRRAKPHHQVEIEELIINCYSDRSSIRNGNDVAVCGRKQSLERGTAGMEKVRFSIPNIHCGHCIKTIERELGEIDGVSSVNGDAATKKVTIEWIPPASLEGIKAALKEINFPVAE